LFKTKILHRFITILPQMFLERWPWKRVQKPPFSEIITEKNFAVAPKFLDELLGA